MKKTELDDYPMTLAKVCEYTGYKRRVITENTTLGHLRAYHHKGKSRFRRYYKKDVDEWLKGEPVQEAS